MNLLRSLGTGPHPWEYDLAKTKIRPAELLGKLELLSKETQIRFYKVMNVPAFCTFRILTTKTGGLECLADSRIDEIPFCSRRVTGYSV